MLKKSAKIAFFIFSLLFIILGIFIFTVYIGAFGHIQNKDELRGFENASASIVLSEEGTTIGKFFSENRTNVSFQQIPSFLIDALVATEDARYFSHKGIDIRSLARVLFKSVLLNDRRAGGGSTISQQLAKNIYGRKHFGPLTLPVNKTKEAILAFRLEKTFSKQEILTLYLNTVSFGENVYGIEAASRRFFNKRVEEMNIEEAALLVGMLKANTNYNPRLYPESAISRRNVVLSQMEKYKYVETTVYDSLRHLPLVLEYSNLESERPAGYFMIQVRNEAEQILQLLNSDPDLLKKWNLEEDGLIINTTLNFSLQEYATESFQDHLSVMQKRLNEQYSSAAGKRLVDQFAELELSRLGLTDRANVVKLRRLFDWNGSYSESLSTIDSLKQAITLLHAGLLALDPQTGAIKAWVGGIDFASQPFDQVLARRQLASTFKPVLYAAALEEGIEPCQYFNNDSIILAGFDGWSPANYVNKYWGKYSLCGALAKSMNSPTFNLFMNISFNNLDSLWRKMGFSFSLRNTPSLALGTAEANLKEVAVAYSSFANGGFMVNPMSIVSITTPGGLILFEKEINEPGNRVLSERSSKLMSAMLQKAVLEGTGASMRNVYGVTLPVAGKTGTSQDYADAWFAAFNPGLVIVSRVGASSRVIHFNSGSNGSGSALALPLVALTLRKVQQDTRLRNQFFTPFPELSPELAVLLDCPDFQEKNVFELFFELFKKDVIEFDEHRGEEEVKKKSLFRRIFGR